LYLPPDIIRIMEGRKVNGWVMYSVCDMRCAYRLWGILNHNEQSTLLLVTYMYTKLQTQWHIWCCQGWLNSLSHFTTQLL